MNDMQRAIYDAVNTLIDQKLQSNPQSKHFIGTIVAVDRGRAQARIETATGTISAVIPAQFSEIEVGAIVMVQDLHGDSQRRYIYNVISGTGLGSGGGGGSGPASNFRVRCSESDRILS